MTLFHLAVLALVQGITEFLPVSSSGHLLLVPVFLNVPDQGLLMDVAVHVGTLGAVVLYFWRDVWNMIFGVWQALRRKKHPGAKLALHVFISTIPVIVAGYVLNKYYGGMPRSIEIVAWATIGFGVLLYLGDRFGMTIRRVEHMRVPGALFIGFMQVLALIPGTSRSGITMTAARIMGYERSDAARFSMLMSIPTILGAGTLKGVELYQSGDAALTSAAFTAAGLAFASALVAVIVLMAWLKRATFTPFVLYRFVLGGALLAMVYLV